MDNLVTGTTVTNVVVVDDHPLFRRGVVELLNDSGDFNVQKDYESALQFLDDLANVAADLLILDLHMPEMSGLELLKALKQREVTQKIVFLTASDDSAELFEAITNGADGYLLKDSAPDEIIKGLNAVMQGNVALDNTGVTLLARHLSKPEAKPEISPNNLDLTDRETQTLELITQGMSNKLIARELGISDGTVKVYVKNLLRKLNVNTRLELAAWVHANPSITEEHS